MNNFEKLKTMDVADFTKKLCFDNDGDMMLFGCAFCVYTGECNDDCYNGILKWLESEEK